MHCHFVATMQHALKENNPRRVVDGEPFIHGKTEGGKVAVPAAVASNAVMYRKSSVINGRNALSPVPHTLTQEFRTESGLPS